MNCNGSEASLTQCAHRGLGVHNCDHSVDAGVICANVLLVGGSGPHEGRVEVYHNGTWGTVCGDGWDLRDATVVCRQLGNLKAEAAVLGSARFGAGSGPILFSELSCIGNESVITECGHDDSGGHNCSHSEDVGIVCVPLRLVGGSSEAEGRVEVFHRGRWGTVCGRGWDLHDATVVCHQLGYGTAVWAPTGAVFGGGSGPIWYDDVRCSGSEASLTQCAHRGLGVHNCDHSVDAGVICANVRLVGGSGPHEGRVEVYHNGTWGTMCGDGWDLRDATVVCRQVGYIKAAAVLGSARFGAGRGPILFSELSCIGNESVIAECGHGDSGGLNCSHSEDVGVVCEVPLRLVGGSSEAEGRVEVFHRGHWGTVCEDGWDLRDATVVCRQLGYGTAVWAPRGAVFGVGSGPIWYDNVNCNGSEASLTQCAHRGLGVHNCGHKHDAGVICANVRLVGGSGPHEGRVEVYHNGTWGTVCGDGWDLRDATVVCRQMGYIKAAAVLGSARFGPGRGPILFSELSCIGNESVIAECGHGDSAGLNCSHCEDVGVVCEVPLRLVGGSSEAEGRVEVFHRGRWGTVCEDGWDLRDATVVCHQLGYGTAVWAPRGAVFGVGSGPIWYDNVNCNGSEASLTQCAHRGLGVHDCAHKHDVGVICANVCLVGGSGPHEGRVEVYHNGTWGTVCGDGWDLRDATVVCRQLGNLKAEAAVLGSARFGAGSGPILFSELSCIGNESVITECGHGDSGGLNCSHNEDVGVVCEVPLRLVGGSSEAEGRVEVFHRGRWGTVCGRGWDLRDATVVCRQLGYGTAVGVPRGAVFVEGSGPIWYDNVNCSGSEASLTQCVHRGLGVHDCGHWEDAGVICANSTCASVHHLAMRMQTMSVYPLLDVMCNATDGCLGAQCTAQWLLGVETYHKFLLLPCQQPRELLLISGSGNQVAWEEVLNHSREVNVGPKADATAQLLSVTFEDWNDSVLLQAELISRDTVVPIVPLAVIPLDDGLCNASKTNATQPELYPLPESMDPVVPSVIGTAIVIAGLVAGLVAIPACVWLKRRKKTTAPVGGAQDQDTAAASAPGSCETSQKPPVVEEVPPVDVSQWEMRYQDLVLKKQIGSGQGGTVILACLKREGTSDTVNNYIRKCQRSSGGPPYYLLVALKRFRAERMRLEMDCFYREVAVMMKVSTGAHPNVISMVGCIPEQPGPAIVMEYAPLGNLHAFLLKYKNKRLPAILPGTVVMPPVSHVETEFQKHYDGLTLEPQDVLHFGRQIASGMEFLASLNILHRDLACRNILLAHDKVLKLADFGLSREVEDTYVSKSVCSLPVRWMAPESVVGKTYTEKSDVWSFGVVLWEICTLGQLPYQHLSNSDAAKAICAGDKLTKPNGCNPELYSVMTDSCWETDPDKRATFSVLKRTLDGLLPDSQQTPPVDLDCELRQQAKEVCPTAPPTQQGTLDATGEDESEIPATLTCWSDPDPRTSEGAPQGNISSCDTTPEDCQVAAQSAVGDDLEITPYSCVTRAAVEIHPPSPPTVEDGSTPLPRLAPPNLVVTPPPKGGDTPPLLPPPRRRGLRTGNAWEMRYKDLKLELPLGCGKFGTVVRATLCKDDDSLRCAHPVARLEMGQGGSDHQWRVAVKRLSDSPTGQDMEAFYNEVAIMKRVSRRGHPHVITMVGYIPREYPPAIVMEFAPLSTLLKFLMKVKDDHTAALVPGHVRMPPPAEVPEELWSYYTSLTMEPSDVLSFGYQIASGMEFLTGLGILHRDLSSRNILMTTGKYLKLADFGLSRETKGVYVSQCFSNLPFRWMAPEALTKLTYTEKSDVWSFGVVLWEMCSLGRLPYYHVRAEHVRDTIVSGGKLTKPDGCNPELYSVMTERCWDVDPAKRATFLQLKKIFDGLLRAALLESCPYMDVVFVVQEQLREECPGLLSSATGASRQPATAEANSTTPEGAGTEGNPDPAAEGGSTPAATGGQDEAEEIPLIEVHDPAAEVLNHPSSAMDDVLFVTPV